jgi:hypothetical protein
MRWSQSGYASPRAPTCAIDEAGVATGVRRADRDPDLGGLALDDRAVLVDGDPWLAGDRVTERPHLGPPAGARPADRALDLGEHGEGDAEIEVQVRPGAAAGVARQADPLAARDDLAVLHQGSREVQVSRRHPRRVADGDPAAGVAAVLALDADHGAGVDHEDRRADGQRGCRARGGSGCAGGRAQPLDTSARTSVATGRPKSSKSGGDRGVSGDGDIAACARRRGPSQGHQRERARGAREDDRDPVAAHGDLGGARSITSHTGCAARTVTPASRSARTIWAIVPTIAAPVAVTSAVPAARQRATVVGRSDGVPSTWSPSWSIRTRHGRGGAADSPSLPGAARALPLPPVPDPRRSSR